MKTFASNTLPAETLFNTANKDMAALRIEDYLKEVKEEIVKTISNKSSIEELVNILKTVRNLDKEVMFIGINLDCHTINHACADFLKNSHLKVIPVSIPELTAFGNDYPYPDNFKELISRRKYGKGNVLIGIQLGGKSPLMDEAFSYNYNNNGINILITDSEIKDCKTHLQVPVSTQNTMAAGDIVQLILHYCSVCLTYEPDSVFRDSISESLQDYCGLLLESVSHEGYSCKALAEMSILLKQRIMSGNTVFSFGNGGSAAIASYLTDGLKKALACSGKTSRNIIDVTSFTDHITACMHLDCYKESVFTQMIRSLCVEEGDILFGISSSGNSENVIHPLTHIPKVTRFGILGFGDGGVIGKSKVSDIDFIVPDAGGFRSYQRAEDGQRIAVSCILSTFGKNG